MPYKFVIKLLHKTSFQRLDYLQELDPVLEDAIGSVTVFLSDFIGWYYYFFDKIGQKY